MRAINLDVLRDPIGLAVNFRRKIKEIARYVNKNRRKASFFNGDVEGTSIHRFLRHNALKRLQDFEF